MVTAHPSNKRCDTTKLCRFFIPLDTTPEQVGTAALSPILFTMPLKMLTYRQLENLSLRVFHWQPNAGTTVNSQMINEVSQCVESINGVKEGRWKATLTFYKPMFEQIRQFLRNTPVIFLGFRFPEQPNRYYFIIRSQKIVLEADSSIQMIMEKLQSYKSRVSLTFEGFQYQLGDFQLRVGKVAPSASENLRGIVFEVLN
ncbi:Mediator of RNA polymerase II transcription subunit 20a [Vitis vinifera]|uniref:Mediator of RNA polymerase II transcription subunit 20 n=1 Tax=Vitis vinifera TaxID=29760 RepID=A0A438E8X1_VITVI|nr:Mediator of RNA polymerase II transcription subunit 20a [Vitis vinifera]